MQRHPNIFASFERVVNDTEKRLANVSSEIYSKA